MGSKKSPIGGNYRKPTTGEIRITGRKTRDNTVYETAEVDAQFHHFPAHWPLVINFNNPVINLQVDRQVAVLTSKVGEHTFNFNGNKKIPTDGHLVFVIRYSYPNGIQAFPEDSLIDGQRMTVTTIPEVANQI